MNTIEIDELTFFTIIGKIEAELTGVDVGRTHGIHQYTRNGKYVGVHSWCGSGSTRENHFEIASYLLDAYTHKED